MPETRPHTPTYQGAGAGMSAEEKAKETARSLAEKGKEYVTEAAEQARDKAKEWASTASEKVGDARSAVGQGMSNLAGKIRDKAPESGMIGSAADSVADNLEGAGSYLQQHDFGDMMGDVSNLIRRYPFQSLLVGLGAGFLLARLTSRD